MSIILGIATVFGLFLAGSLVLIFRKLVSDESLPVEADWIEQVSPGRYHPMERLLDEGEYSRLQRHPAISRKMLRQLRIHRVQVFRGYLGCLSVDFGRVCSAIKLLMVQAAVDKPDLARLLVKQRVSFSLRLVITEYRLTLHALGVGSVDAGKLVAALDTIRLELNTLMAAAQPAGA